MNGELLYGLTARCAFKIELTIVPEPLPILHIKGIVWQGMGELFKSTTNLQPDPVLQIYENTN